MYLALTLVTLSFGAANAAFVIYGPRPILSLIAAMMCMFSAGFYFHLCLLKD